MNCLNLVIPMFKLHDYQHRLVNEARQEIAKGNKGVLIQSPPGSGKSVVIADVIKKTTEKGGHVLFLVHRKELSEQITQTLQAHEVDLWKVTIMTIGKAVNRLNKIPYPSIIVTDETHHSRAATYMQIYEYFNKAVLLGFTATPYRMNGKGFTDIYTAAVYGETVDWLIQNNNLAPFKYYGVNLADEHLLKKSSTGDYTKKSIDNAVDKAIYGDVVQHYKKLAEGRRAILYAHSVEASEQIADEFKHHGIKAVHADAKTPKAQRENIMQAFRNGEIQVLCNVDLISEGFDVPDCSCVIQMRPTASLVLFMQQSMRSMRYQPNKEAIIIDHVGNFTRHGLPNTEHNWGEHFAGTAKNKRSSKVSDDLQMTDCPECFGVFEGKHDNCPLCGFELQTEEQKELERIDAELVEIDQSFSVDYTLVNYAKKDISDLETLDDYYLFAVATNKKPAWIKFAYEPFKQLSWPQFYQKLNPIKQKYNY